MIDEFNLYITVPKNIECVCSGEPYWFLFITCITMVKFNLKVVTEYKFHEIQVGYFIIAYIN